MLTTRRFLPAFVMLLLFCGGVAGNPVTAADLSRTWDFEHGVSGWELPGGESGVVVDPANPHNHVFHVVATRPHHTQLILRDSERTPDFVASCRFKVLSWSGEPPALYVYGRLSGGQFRAACVSGESLTVFAWYNRETPSQTAGVRTLPPIPSQTWLHVSMACFQGFTFAKAWIEGQPEPRWQTGGELSGLAHGRFAVGVWTSPRTPSRAEVLVDDITFAPLNAAAAEQMGLHIHPRPALPAGALPVASGAFEIPSDVGIASKSCVLTFDRRTGEISHLVDRAAGLDFISPAAYRPLFEIHLTKPYQGMRTDVSSDDFREVTVRPNGDRVELRFNSAPAADISATVTAVRADDDMIHLGIAIQNHTDWAVAAISFPEMAWVPALDADENKDALVLPWGGGAILPAPGTMTQQRSSLYPGSAFAQFTAWCGERASLYLAAEDADGNCKRWNLRTSKAKSVELFLQHLFPEVTGRDAVLPYDVVLKTFRGDWRDAADIYKQWVCRQPWCRKTLDERDDIPQFLKEGSGVIITGIQNAHGYNGAYGPALEKLPELVAAYHHRTGLAHVIFVPYGWENRGTWAGINYFPTHPSDAAWRQANAALKAQGDRTAFLTSGFWWVVKRKTTGDGPAFDDSTDFARRQAMVIHNVDGSPWFVDNYANTTSGGSWRGLSAKLCHGSAEARDTMCRIFLDVARLGVPLISFDQEIGGGQEEPCYSRSHGHPPGYGNWMWTGFRDTCAQILRDGKPVQPELGLFMEDVSELAIPYMSTYWSRQFGEVDVGATGGRGVGLFSYLYHEYVTAIGAACVQGQGAPGTPTPASLRCFAFANNLTRGLIPGPFLQDVPLEPRNDWQRQVSSAYFSYCQPYAHFPEYLVRGTTQRPPQVECANEDSWFYRRSAEGEPLRPGGPRVVKVPLALPVVTAGSFAAADGSLGTVIVNVTGHPQQATLRFERPGAAVLYRADRGVVQSWTKLAAGQPVRVELEPFGTRMIRIVESEVIR